MDQAIEGKWLDMETIKTKKSGYELIKIPGGTFMMGSPKNEKGRVHYEGPRHKVTVPDFYMGKYLVTNKQYGLFLEEHPDVRKPYFWDNSDFNRPDQPVVGVRKMEAGLFGEWEGLWLPPESQWEYACRAGSATRYYNGNTDEDLDRIGWYKNNSGGVTHPVGQKEPNVFGLFDMLGNAFEWVIDLFHDHYHGAPDDGMPWFEGFSIFGVIRGGAFFVESQFCRSAFRSECRPDLPIDHIGFRLAVPAWFAEESGLAKA